MPEIVSINIPFLLCSRSGAGTALIQCLTHVPEPGCDAVVVRNRFGARLSAPQEKSAGQTVEIGRGRDVDGSARCAFRKCQQRWNAL